MVIKDKTLIGTFEEKKALVKDFNLLSDNFFAMVMNDNKAFEVLIRTLLQKDDLTVTEVRTQYELRNIVGHSVRLDGYAEDSEGKIYNIEVQVMEKGYHPNRVRYYQSSLDTSLFARGKAYEDLPDLYIIFITAFDVFEKGQVCYEVQRVLKGFGDEVSNGVHELYFNTKVKDNTEVSKFLQYLASCDTANNDYGELSNRVRYYKETEEGVDYMCEAVKNYGDEREALGKAEGEAVGRAKQIVELVGNLKKSGHTLNEALLILKCSPTKYEECLEIISKEEEQSKQG